MSAFWYEIAGYGSYSAYHADFMLIDAKETIRYLVKNEPQMPENKAWIRELEKEINDYKNGIDYCILPNLLRIQAIKYIRNGFKHVS